jgi:hypothetical protein
VSVAERMASDDNVIKLVVQARDSYMRNKHGQNYWQLLD